MSNRYLRIAQFRKHEEECSEKRRKKNASRVKKRGSGIIGGNYQRQWMKASSEQFIANISTQNNYNDSYVLTVGHGSDWIW